MHCEQDVLHDILGLIEGLSGSRQAPARHGPQDRCESLKRLAISAAVAYIAAPHKVCPFVFMFAHTRS
jgi:hypothetical protein